MLMLTGRDQPKIVSSITQKLYELDCMLGESSMQRLGCSFSMMMMIQSTLAKDKLSLGLENITDNFELHFRINEIKEPGLNRHHEPDYRIIVHGADKLGIIAKVTGALADMGANIIDLESVVAGTADEPIYVLSIEITLKKDEKQIKKVLDNLKLQVSTVVHPLDSLIG